MSEKNARTLSHTSNRVKPRDTKDKKVAFKGALDSPFRIQWPSVPLTLQRSILECIIDLLDGASDYHHHRSLARRKRKRVCKAMERASRKNKETSEPAVVSVNKRASNELDYHMHLDQDIQQCETHDANTEPPVFLRHLSYGINVVTKRLEVQTQSARHPNILTLPETSETPPKPLKYVFVCRADVDPPLLIEHLPHLIAAYNSARPPQYAKLIPLPQGSESVLAQILGIRRVTALGLDMDFPDDTRLKTLLESIPILAASWSSQSTPITPLIQTHIKLLRTTTPKDMKEAKESRLQGRAEAKRRKTNHSSLK
ncbi:hypothetical protein HYPSUDRAFT_129067 [Hypholoma sublateritium FD-334 SS-4]|uniref:Uncharacterized protein n=1 Tax=Hypholoma sublateritium (strain FD-334 SS-4) TaxID=945553 RepID=A0A0D2QAP6_HYPSF|nr:hypothetical protein HYPSUDRAFT_129067 [Hypholoma sublateritium FD-334 SS-4]